jgi:hypothetical protein
MRTGAGGPAPREMRVTDRLVLGWLSAYLSGATFILQGMCGLSPQAYSYAFGLNSLGSVVFGFLGRRASERWSVPGTLMAGRAWYMGGTVPTSPSTRLERTVLGTPVEVR